MFCHNHIGKVMHAKLFSARRERPNRMSCSVKTAQPDWHWQIQSRQSRFQRFFTLDKVFRNAWQTGFVLLLKKISFGQLLFNVGAKSSNQNAKFFLSFLSLHLLSLSLFLSQQEQTDKLWLSMMRGNCIQGRNTALSLVQNCETLLPCGARKSIILLLNCTPTSDDQSPRRPDTARSRTAINLTATSLFITLLWGLLYLTVLQ